MADQEDGGQRDDEWETHQCPDSGRYFYHHRDSGASHWIDGDDESEDGSAGADGEKEQQGEPADEQEQEEKPAEGEDGDDGGPVEVPEGWSLYTDDSGREFYYHHNSKYSSWEHPEKLWQDSGGAQGNYDNDVDDDDEEDYYGDRGGEDGEDEYGRVEDGGGGGGVLEEVVASYDEAADGEGGDDEPVEAWGGGGGVVDVPDGHDDSAEAATGEGVGLQHQHDAGILWDEGGEEETKAPFDDELLEDPVAVAAAAAAAAGVAEAGPAARPKDGGLAAFVKAHDLDGLNDFDEELLPPAQARRRREVLDRAIRRLNNHKLYTGWR